jgi:hypothetical protein
MRMPRAAARRTLRGMDVLVVFESVYGNTRAIAEAVADGARDAGAQVALATVGEAPAEPRAGMLIVGGPTHMHGLTTDMTRRMAARAAHEDGHELDPSADEELGLRSWLRHLPTADHVPAAAFDTRGDASSALTGSAARGIARRLRHHGYEVHARASFLVDDAEGPLADGELDRARRWGAELAGAPRPQGATATRA